MARRRDTDPALRMRIAKWVIYFTEVEPREFKNAEALAAKMGCASNELTEIKRGKKTCGLDFFYKLWRATGFSADKMLRDDPVMPPDMAQEKKARLLRLFAVAEETILEKYGMSPTRRLGTSL